MRPYLEETIYIDFVTCSSTGAAVDADSTPTAEVFEDTSDVALISPSVSKRTSKTGNYRIPLACTTANGFESGKSYNVVASATISSITAKAVVGTFQVRDTPIDVSTSEVYENALQAISYYDPPTRSELSSDITSLNDISTSEVNTAVELVLNAQGYSSPRAALLDYLDASILSRAATGDIMMIDTSQDVGMPGSTPKTVGECLVAAWVQAGGKWVLDTNLNTLTLSAADGTTSIFEFTVDNPNAPTSRTPN